MGGWGHRAPLHGERSDRDAIGQMANVARNPYSILCSGVSRLLSSAPLPPLLSSSASPLSSGSLVAAVLVRRCVLLLGYPFRGTSEKKIGYFFPLFRKAFSGSVALCFSSRVDGDDSVL